MDPLSRGYGNSDYSVIIFLRFSQIPNLLPYFLPDSIGRVVAMERGKARSSCSVKSGTRGARETASGRNGEGGRDGESRGVQSQRM